MTTSRTAGRVRRVVLAAAGLGMAALAVAPAASAASGSAYPPAPPSQRTQVLGVKYGSTTSTSTWRSTSTARSSGTQVLGVKYSADALAFTGAEVGGVAVAGLALVVSGALLVRGGRRRSSGTA